MSESYSVLGNGNHSKKIQKILRRLKKKFNVYTSKDLNYQKKIDEISNSKAIFIITPNHTHFKLIKLFKKKYIFCEKPPVTNLKDYNNLKKINNGKIYLNFNRKYSKLYFYLRKLISKHKLGNLVYGMFISSKGLAQKNSYKNNWRSKKKFIKTGVFENVSIHSLDLIEQIFGIKGIKNKLTNNAKIGTAPDTSTAEIQINNGNLITVFATYNSSLDFFIKLYFKNGIFIYDGKYLSLKYPTNSFNRNGQFVVPPTIFKQKLIFMNDNIYSLEQSIKIFLKTENLKKKFPQKDFKNSLKINKYIF